MVVIQSYYKHKLVFHITLGVVRILIVQVVVPLLITVLPLKYGLEVRAKFSPSACTQISVLPVPKLPGRPYFQVLIQCSKRVRGKQHFGFGLLQKKINFGSL